MICWVIKAAALASRILFVNTPQLQARVAKATWPTLLIPRIHWKADHHECAHCGDAYTARSPPFHERLQDKVILTNAKDKSVDDRAVRSVINQTQKEGIFGAIAPHSATRVLSIESVTSKMSRVFRSIGPRPVFSTQQLSEVSVRGPPGCPKICRVLAFQLPIS